MLISETVRGYREKRQYFQLDGRVRTRAILHGKVNARMLVLSNSPLILALVLDERNHCWLKFHKRHPPRCILHKM